MSYCHWSTGFQLQRLLLGRMIMLVSKTLFVVVPFGLVRALEFI